MLLRKLTSTREGQASLLTVAVLGANFLREISIGYLYGTGSGIDAYYVVWSVILFLTGVFASALNASLIPAYLRAREDGEEAAARLLRTLVLLGWAVGGGLALVLALGAGPLLGLLGHGFDPARRALATTMLRGSVLVLPLSLVSSTLASVLVAQGRFRRAVLSPAVRAAGHLGVAMALHRAWGVQALLAGLWTGFALEFLFLLAEARAAGLPLGPKWAGWGLHEAETLRQFTPVLLGSLALGASPIVDHAMASFLGAGSNARLNFASRIVSPILTVLIAPINYFVYPRMVKLIMDRDWNVLRALLRKVGLFFLVGGGAAALLLAVASGPIARLLYGHGQFTGTDVRIIAVTQTCYMAQLPFYLLGTLYSRMISAFSMNRLLLYGNLLGLVVNALADYILMKRFGMPGIALSTSIVYLVSFSYLALASHRLLRLRAAAGGA